ncbi:META domain-containing protein [Marinobacter mobilis]|uniref:META domain-containing protein n=1 Tax=Marinobacter mobilis TaxID=488533 RepID=UPI0035C71036
MKNRTLVGVSLLVAAYVSLMAGCAMSTPDSADVNAAGNQSLMQLHDIWVLETLDREALELVSERQRPRMELNHREMTMSGFDGCNNLRGAIRHLDAEAIEFGPIIATRKACPDMTLSDRFQLNLTQVRGYTRQNLKLYLLDQNGNEILSFQKTD